MQEAEYRFTSSTHAMAITLSLNLYTTDDTDFYNNKYWVIIRAADFND